MGALRAHHRAFAWAGLLVLAVKLIVSTLCHVAPSSRTGTYFDDILGHVLICASGSQYSAASEGPPGPEPSPAHKPSDCPACTLLALMLLAVVLTLLGTVAPRLAVPVPRWTAAPTLAIQLASGAIRQRAPPSFS